MANKIVAMVRCAGCQEEALAYIVITNHEGNLLKKIEPPRSWRYVWAAGKNRETSSLFACNRWCTRDVMTDIMTNEHEDVVFSWCEQTQIKEKYYLNEE